MPKLRLRADLHMEIVPPDMVFLLSEVQYYTLKGPLYVRLFPFLNGQYSAEQIADQLIDQASSVQISYALHRLLKAGYIVEVADGESIPHDAATDAYLELQGFAADTSHRLHVGLHSFGLNDPVLLTDLAGMFERANIATHSDAPDFHVVLTQDYLQPDLAPFNQHMLAAGTPWLLIKPVGAALWIGPIFKPGETACWACLAQRLRRNRRVEAFIENKLGLSAPIMLSRGALPSTILTALSIAVSETIHWSASATRSATSELAGKLIVLDSVTLQSTQHAVIRRPQCPVCGKPDSEQPQPITLHSRPKVSGLSNGYRTERAQETYDRYKQHVSPITGAVSMLEPRFSNELIHVYVSGDNTSRPLTRWENMRRSLRSLNGGKGADDLQAKVSALCEALERYSGQYEGNEASQSRLYQAAAGDMIHPESLLLFSDAQYADREWLNEHNPPNLMIPVRFDASRPIDWSPVWSLTDHRWQYIPTSYCYYAYPLPPDHYFGGADSNGCAAGSSIEDAILQGFLELVERDAVAIWWYNRIRRPEVPFDQPYLEKIRDYYASIQREIWLIDITTDFNIPVYVAVSRRIDKAAEDIIMGFGAHLDPEIAALRAVTEMNQMLGPVLNVTEDGSAGYSSELPWEIDWWQHATIATEPYLAPDPQLAPIQHDSYSIPEHNDVREDVLFCIERVREKGMHMLVLDQTRPDIGLPVVKLMVPGMRHFWGRFAPGRLYDVPVTLGWLSDPTPEADLNPHPMTL